MVRQRNNPQLKGKEESPEKELSEIEASNLSDTEFKILVIRIPRNSGELPGTLWELQGT